MIIKICSFWKILTFFREKLNQLWSLEDLNSREFYHIRDAESSSLPHFGISPLIFGCLHNAIHIRLARFTVSFALKSAPNYFLLIRERIIQFPKSKAKHLAGLRLLLSHFLRLFRSLHIWHEHILFSCRASVITNLKLVLILLKLSMKTVRQSLPAPLVYCQSSTSSTGLINLIWR